MSVARLKPILNPPPIHATVFTMLLLRYGGLRKPVQKFKICMTTHATV